MRSQYQTLATYQRGPFKVIVDKHPEDTLSPRDLFDSIDCDEMCEKIDSGEWDWFCLRTRVLLDGTELAENSLGGCCYADADEVLTDGTAEDQIEETMSEARTFAKTLRDKLQSLELT